MSYSSFACLQINSFKYSYLAPIFYALLNATQSAGAGEFTDFMSKESEDSTPLQ